MVCMVLVGDCRDRLAEIPAKSVHTVVTSPPYFGLRDYGQPDQIGLEPTPDEFVAAMVTVFREVRRVLRDDGTVWLNLGDTYAQHKGGTAPPAQTVAGGVRGVGGEKERRGQKGGYNATRDPTAHGLKHKELMGIPWRVAFALQADGWYLRQDIIWAKPNPMPESVKDRCTKAHEYIFLLSKSPNYYFDNVAIQEAATGDLRPAPQYEGRGQHVEGRKRRGVPPQHAGYESSDQSGLDAVGRGGFRNRRSVWTIATKPFKGAHFATFPPALIEPCVLAGAPLGGIVLDPFGGAGTTGLVAETLGRDSFLVELNPEYAAMIVKRLAGAAIIL